MERLLTMIAGVTGTGKSYFVKNKLLPQMKAKKPVIVFDRMGEYAGPGAKDVPEKWPRYSGYKEFFKSIEENGGILSKDIHVILCESDNDYKNVIGLFTKLRKSVALVIEEAHDLFSAPEFKDVSRWLIKIARYGRKFGIDFVLISQRTKDVPPDVRSQFNGNVISFKQAYEEDAKALKSIGCPEAEKVLALEPRDFEIFGELPKYINLSK